VRASSHKTVGPSGEPAGTTPPAIAGVPLGKQRPQAHSHSFLSLISPSSCRSFFCAAPAGIRLAAARCAGKKMVRHLPARSKGLYILSGQPQSSRKNCNLPCFSVSSPRVMNGQCDGAGPSPLLDSGRLLVPLDQTRGRRLQYINHPDFFPSIPSCG